MWKWQAALLLPFIDQVPANIQPTVRRYADPAAITSVPIPLMWIGFREFGVLIFSTLMFTPIVSELSIGF